MTKVQFREYWLVEALELCHLVLALGFYIRLLAFIFKPIFYKYLVDLEREAREREWRNQGQEEDKVSDFGRFKFQIIFWNKLMVKVCLKIEFN